MAKRKLPPHGTEARYKHKTSPCRCRKCKDEHARNQRAYRRRVGLTKNILVPWKSVK